MRRYVQHIDGVEQPEGVWVQPVRKGFRFVCCDCGAVHNIDFRVRRGRPQISVKSNRRATAAKRRRERFKFRSR